MKASFLTFVVVGFLGQAAVVCAGSKDKNAPAEKKSEDRAAVINGKAISRDDLLQQISDFKKKEKKEGTSIPEEKIYEALREEMIRLELLRAEAKKSNLESNPEFQERLREARENILLRLYMKSLQDKWTASLTEDLIKKEVEKLKKTEHALVLERIVVPNEQTAQRIKAAAASGKPLSELAKTYAVDKNQSVSMDPIPEAILPKDALKMFSEMKVGELVIVPEKGAVAVLKYIARKPLQDEKILTHIARQKLITTKGEEFFKSVEKASKIERFDLDGKPVSAPEEPKE